MHKCQPYKQNKLNLINGLNNLILKHSHESKANLCINTQSTRCFCFVLFDQKMIPPIIWVLLSCPQHVSTKIWKEFHKKGRSTKFESNHLAKWNSNTTPFPSQSSSFNSIIIKHFEPNLPMQFPYTSPKAFQV